MSDQKLKLLYIMKILQENTDEDNPMNAAQIIKELNKYGIQAERKSVYSDIELLRDQFNMDIVSLEDKRKGYFVASNVFQLPEIKLLVDAVESSPIITKKMSDELIKKLSALTSKAQAKTLKPDVSMADRKTINKQVDKNIDKIHKALNENRQISFKYLDHYNEQEPIYRRQGEKYQTTPVTLCWNQDRYYLVAYKAKYTNFTHYRVDRMHFVEILEAKGEAFDRVTLNVSDHVKRVFGMYGGESVRARLAFHDHLKSTVQDRFGQEISIFPSDDMSDWFEIVVEVTVSAVFFSWITQFEENALVKAPDTLITAIRAHLNRVLEKYK